MTSKEWKREYKSAKKLLSQAASDVGSLEECIDDIKYGKLRTATCRDIVDGAMIIYPCDEYPEDTHVRIINEVLYPNDDFKAFVDHEGCRLGLAGAYVEC
jgi:hypothetical protein